MNTSYYFEELWSAYAAEIDDLASDYEGKSVLAARLQEKRREIGTMLQMIEAAPEMVVPVFYGAFRFLQPAALHQAVLAEPDDEDFPDWEQLATAIELCDWAKPLVEQVLAEAGGDRFLVSAAAVEFLRLRDFSAPQPADENAAGHKDEPNEAEDGEDQDLAEAGADWLAEQGFDSQGA